MEQIFLRERDCVLASRLLDSFHILMERKLHFELDKTNLELAGPPTTATADMYS